MLKFVVTGTGRSGTAYTSRVLCASGLNCPHEVVFRPREPDLARFDRYDGDASFYAAPFLDRLPPGTIVFHQVREPLAVISSWAEREAFRRIHIEDNFPKHLTKRLLRIPPSGSYASYRFIREWCPRAFEEKGTAARAARYWVDWNRMVEANAESARLPYYRYRLQDMPAIVAEIRRMIGAEESDADASEVPRTVNAGRSSRAVILDDLPAPLAEEVLVLGRRYGLT